MSANPDFDRIQADGENYHYETIPETFARLAAEQPAAYEGAWSLWLEGRPRELIRPQFHGREHLSVDVLERKLRNRSADLLVNLENRSLTSLGPEPSLPGVGFSHAFGMYEVSQLPRHRKILRDGLYLFEKTWAIPSLTFTPPALKIYPSNVVFEPNVDVWSYPVTHAMDEIAAAFRWKKPAIISSHRVNFCGRIAEDNRKKGLEAHRVLLERMTTRWPEVELLSADELVTEMAG